jgi:hypothetical protein
MTTDADTTNPNPTRVVEDDDHNPIGPNKVIPDFCRIARGLMNCPSC